MIGYYNYTVILTYIGTLSGFAGITFIWNGDVKTALICLMVAGFCDMFDGKIASTMERTVNEQRFGIQIDSLSDLVCFGVLPALIAFECSGGVALSAAASAIYLMCALIRLAWFNVDEEERQAGEGGRREVYLGLPVTSAALLVPFAMGIGHAFDFPIDSFLPWLMLIIGAAFLAPFNLRKPGRKGQLLMLILGTAALAAVLLGGGI